MNKNEKQDLFNALKMNHFLAKLNEFETVTIKNETILLTNKNDYYLRMSGKEYLDYLSKKILKTLSSNLNPKYFSNNPVEFLNQISMTTPFDYKVNNFALKYYALILKLLYFAKEQKDIIFSVDYSDDFKITLVSYLDSKEKIEEFEKQVNYREQYFSHNESLILDLDSILWFENVSKTR